MAQGNPKSDTKLSSWRDAQRQESTILSGLNAEPTLILAALANPLLALEKLGYEIDDDLKQEIEDRLRFPKNYDQITSLRKKIFETAGKSFALHSAESVHATLSSLLEKKVAYSLTVADTAPVFATPGAKTGPDPLERLVDAHPIMRALIQYRRLQAEVPPFAAREVYDDIRHGKRTPPVTNIMVRVSREHKE